MNEQLPEPLEPSHFEFLRATARDAQDQGHGMSFLVGGTYGVLDGAVELLDEFTIRVHDRRGVVDLPFTEVRRWGGLNWRLGLREAKSWIDAAQTAGLSIVHEPEDAMT